MTLKKTLPKPVYPVFIFEGHDISVFLSNDNVGNYLEHYDVKDSLFIGYDYEGYPLDLYFEEDKVVKCRRASDEDRCLELLDKLTEALRDTKYSTQPVNAETLKAICVALFVERGL